MDLLRMDTDTKFLIDTEAKSSSFNLVLYYFLRKIVDLIVRGELSEAQMKLPPTKFQCKYLNLVF
jgi:hypothetical protein